MIIPAQSAAAVKNPRENVMFLPPMENAPFVTKGTHHGEAFNPSSLFRLAFQGSGAFLQRLVVSRAKLPEQAADSGHLLARKGQQPASRARPRAPFGTGGAIALHSGAPRDCAHSNLNPRCRRLSEVPRRAFPSALILLSLLLKTDPGLRQTRGDGLIGAALRLVSRGSDRSESLVRLDAMPRARAPALSTRVLHPHPGAGDQISMI